MKKLTAGLICLAIALVLIFVFIIPLWDSLSILKINLSAREAELGQLKARVEKVNHLKKEYQNMESEVQKVLLALPAEEDIPNLLVQFEALATGNGLILENISFGQLAKDLPTGQPLDAMGEFVPQQTAQAKESGLRSLSVSMSLSGRYLNFKNYLKSLAGNIRSMSAETVSFSSSDLLEDSFSFDLNVNVYYQ